MSLSNNRSEQNNTAGIVDQPARDQALDITVSICVTAPAGSGKTELLTQRILKLLATVEQPEQILAITFTRKAAAEMRERVITALQSATDSEPPEAEHKRLSWQLARAVLERNSEQRWDLLQNPGRLRLQTIDSLCQSIAADLPILSLLGAKLKPVDDPERLYRQAVDAFLQELNSDSEIADAISAVLLHLDNNVARFYQLLIGMLPLRDQWLGHASQFRSSDMAQQSLEATLSRWIEQELGAAAEILQPFTSDLCASADFAASQIVTMPKENAGSSIGLLKGIVELPKPLASQHEQWAAIIELLCTKEGKLRKQVDKRQGFPAKTASKDKQMSAEFELRKKTMKQLLLTMQDSAEIPTILGIVASLPVKGYQAAHWQILSPLTICLVRVCAHLKVVFGNSGQCDYNEITASALRALTEEIDDAGQLVGSQESDSLTAVAYKWNQNIRHILVDEFQDTAVAQFELLKGLTAQWHQDNMLAAEDAGANAPVNAKTLFVVGDGMQSIYGFRAAKVGLFLTAKHIGIGDLPLQPVDLVQNFRSTAAIVEWNNQHFTEAFPDKIDISRGAVPYSRAKSITQLQDVDTENPACELLVCTDEQGRDTEASQVVAAILQQQQLQADGSIAILVRFRSHLREIIPALIDAGIDWQGVDIDPLKNREVILDCLSLSRALYNPADSIAWLAVLRAPWCGLSLVDLQRLADLNVSESSLNTLLSYVLYDRGEQFNNVLTQLSDDGAQRLAIFAKGIRRVWQSRGRKNLRQWIESAWLSLHGPLLAKNSFNGDDRHSAMAFFDLLESIEQDCQLSGKPFSIALLENSIERLYAPTINLTTDSNTLAPVQIMTIHKSKGLEFDTVIVPGLDRTGPSDDKPLLSWNEHLFDDGNAGLVLCPIDAIGGSEQDAIARLDGTTESLVGKKTSSDLYQFLRDENKRVSTFESTRLLYVAATRAKSKLVLLANLALLDSGDLSSAIDSSNIKAPAENALLSRLWPSVAAEAKICRGDEALLADTLVTNEPVYPSLKRFDLATLQSLAASRDDQDQHLAEASLIDAELIADVNDAYVEDTVPTLIGTCVHEIFEQIGIQGIDQWSAVCLDDDFDGNYDGKQKYWRFKLLQSGIGSNDIDMALTLVSRAVKNLVSGEVGRWIFDSGHQHIHNEWPISRLQSVAADSDPAIVSGSVSRFVIDRSFIDSDQCRWVIDYKVASPAESESTDNKANAEQDFITQQIQRYSAQLNNYKQLVMALDAVDNNTVVDTRCALYFPLLDRLVELNEL